ncbi:LysR family transcriptional regulator [Litorisediminicola beolgyonensis]
MDWLNLPPLSALRAFAAYTETGSVSRAGDLLNVSHAAISQQLRSLETRLGVALIDRSGRSLKLTEEGRQLADAVEAGFGRIGHAIDALTGAELDRPLAVSTSPSFAANWLMSRLGEFQVLHPEIDIMISPTPALVDPSPGGIDLCIRYGAGTWPGVESERLLTSPITVVAAPSLIGDLDPQTPEDLLPFPWIEELGTNESTLWLESRGVFTSLRRSRIQVPGNLMLDGARNGQGIVVSTLVAVEEDVRAGRLRVLFEDRMDDGYHLITRPGVHRPPLKAFLRWIRKSAREESRARVTVSSDRS